MIYLLAAQEICGTWLGLVLVNSSFTRLIYLGEDLGKGDGKDAGMGEGEGLGMGMGESEGEEKTEMKLRLRKSHVTSSKRSF
jgi:hypothetical protein